MLALYCLRSLGVSSHWVLIFCCLRVPRNNPKPTPLIFVIISTQFHSLWCRGYPTFPLFQPDFSLLEWWGICHTAFQQNTCAFFFLLLRGVWGCFSHFFLAQALGNSKNFTKDGGSKRKQKSGPHELLVIIDSSLSPKWKEPIWRYPPPIDSFLKLLVYSWLRFCRRISMPAFDRAI